ncbi:MAG TPA: iron-siderophore ABC transporter substrate-binding protein [Pseudonocardiaceae bacterium]|nr:iron-siderophore ABC transporter substrate-binding protein [Pseudonocardiaceae bacterium]
MRSRRSYVLLAASAALVLSGCGTTEAPRDETGGGGAQISVTDSRGKQIVLDSPATEVVGLEWNAVEHLVSLGVMPVGVADVKGYGNWVSAAPLDDSVTEVGVRGEPSIDSIAALAPDLVLATSDLPEAAVAQLERFTPVLVLRPADAAKGIEQMRDNVRIVAEVTGRQDSADRLLADFDAKLAEGAQALAAAGLAGERFAFADAFLDGSQVSIRPFADGSLICEVTEAMGMVNAWKMEGDAEYGLAETDVEGLTALGDVRFLYIVNDADGGDPFTDVLAGNAIWQSLPFVQNGHVYRLPDGIWMFGGPASMQQYIDAVVQALTA